jgi:hypothetical protein
LFPNPGPVPDKLLAVPGFIEDVSTYHVLRTVSEPRVGVHRGVGASAFLVGRKYRISVTTGQFVSDRAGRQRKGKDHPRKVNFTLPFAPGLREYGDAFASAKAWRTRFSCTPPVVQADEFDCIFNTMKYNKDARAESINEKLLKFYGSANSLYPMRKKAMVKKKGCEEKMEVAHIVNPNLVLFGTAVPKYFYESLSRRVLENGLVARCIIVEAGKRGEAGTAMPIAPADSLLGRQSISLTSICRAIWHTNTEAPDSSPKRPTQPRRSVKFRRNATVVSIFESVAKVERCALGGAHEENLQAGDAPRHQLERLRPGHHGKVRQMGVEIH